MPRNLFINSRNKCTYIKTSGDYNTEEELYLRLRDPNGIIRCILENPYKFLHEAQKYIEYYKIKNNIR
jgi:hypothetical protein